MWEKVCRHPVVVLFQQLLVFRMGTDKQLHERCEVCDLIEFEYRQDHQMLLFFHYSLRAGLRDG